MSDNESQMKKLKKLSYVLVQGVIYKTKKSCSDLRFPFNNLNS